MHLGGAMHREFAPMRTVHLAQILANTRSQPVEELA
jgi:hypothetical protein